MSELRLPRGARLAAAPPQPAEQEPIVDAPVRLPKGARIVTPPPAPDAAPQSQGPLGQISKGNIDPFDRPRIMNPDGGYSTTSSENANFGDGETIYPTVADGQRLTSQQAQQRFRDTGENLGTFDTPENADRFAQHVHEVQQEDVAMHGTPASAGEVYSTAINRGLAANMRAGSDSTPLPTDPVETRYGAPYDFGSAPDADTGKKILYKTVHGLAESAPEVAGGIAGGAIGTALGGPLATAAGVGGGAALVHVVKKAAPIFKQELDATPNDPDGAFHRAALKTGIAAGSTGVGFAAFGLEPFEGEIKNLLFQAFAVQPPVAAAEQAATNLVDDRPVGEGVVQAAAEAPGGVLPFAIPHMLPGGRRAAAPAGGPPGGEPAPAQLPSPEKMPPPPGGSGTPFRDDVSPEQHAAAARAANERLQQRRNEAAGADTPSKVYGEEEAAPRTSEDLGENTVEHIRGRIGEDPLGLVHEQLGITAEEFVGLSGDAKERIVLAAQRQRSASRPNPETLRSADEQGLPTFEERARQEAGGATVTSEGEHTPAAPPMPATSRQGQEQPTETTVEAPFNPDSEDLSAQPAQPEYARTSAGGSERPFKANDTGGATPEQSAGFEQRARDTAEQARKDTVEDLLRRWKEEADARYKPGASEDAEATDTYKGAKFSNKSKGQDKEGRFHVDDYGYVVSSKGGPIRFASHTDAARWIIKANKTGTDQIFDRANHPVAVPKGEGDNITIKVVGKRGAEEGPADTRGTPGGQEPLRLPEGATHVPEPEMAMPGGSNEKATKPQTLMDYLAHVGVDPEATDLTELRHINALRANHVRKPGVKRIIRKGGVRSVAELVQRAEQEGFLNSKEITPDSSTPYTSQDARLLDAALERHLKGEDTFRGADAEAGARHAAENQDVTKVNRDQLEQRATEMGIDHKGLDDVSLAYKIGEETARRNHARATEPAKAHEETDDEIDRITREQLARESSPEPDGPTSGTDIDPFELTSAPVETKTKAGVGKAQGRAVERTVDRGASSEGRAENAEPDRGSGGDGEGASRASETPAARDTNGGIENGTPRKNAGSEQRVAPAPRPTGDTSKPEPLAREAPPEPRTARVQPEPAVGPVDRVADTRKDDAGAAEGFKLEHDAKDIDAVRDKADELEEYHRAFLQGREPNRGDYKSEFNYDSAVEEYRAKHGDDKAADLDRVLGAEARRLSKQIDDLQAPEFVERDRQQRDFEDRRKAAAKEKRSEEESAAVAKSLNTVPKTMKEWVDHVLAKAHVHGKMSVVVKSYGVERPITVRSLTRSNRHDALIGNVGGLKNGRRRLTPRQMDAIAKQVGATRLRAIRENEKASLSSGKQTYGEQTGTRTNPSTDLASARAVIDHEASPAQKSAGNYQKGHVERHGFDITLETAKGEVRSSHKLDADGKPKWSVTMPVDYGYIKRTEGADGEGIDVFLGPNAHSDKVFVIDQVDAMTKAPDEQKVMLGFDNRVEATKAYKQSFSDHKGWARIGKIVETTVEKLKAGIKDMWKNKDKYSRGYIHLGDGPGRGETPRKDREEPHRTAAGPSIAAGRKGPFKKLAEAYTRRAEKLIVQPFMKHLGWRFDALGKLPWKDDYMIKRYLALGKIAKVDENINNIYKALRPAGPADRKAIFEYLTTKNATTRDISPAFRDVATEAKSSIDRVGRALVARGLLSKESYDKYAGSYLPRIYLKHILDNEGGGGGAGAGKAVSDMGYLKERKDIDEETRMLILGEIQDPAFLASQGIGKPQRDIAILDFINEIGQNHEWALPESFVEWKGKRVSAVWLKGESKRVAEMAAYLDHGGGNASAVREEALGVAREMGRVADGGLDHPANTPEMYRQVPDTNRYGVLRGIWIRKEIYDDLIGGTRMLPRDASAMESLLGVGGKGTKINGWWKLSKVALNPPSQIRNFMSNAMLIQLSGVPLMKVPSRIIEAITDMKNDGAYWKVAKKYGVKASTFTSAELTTIHREIRDLKMREGGSWQKIHDLASILHNMSKAKDTAANAGATVVDAASKMYALSESIFKTAMILHGMKYEGKSERQAVLDSQDAVFDYSLVPKSVRYARNAPIGAPFISWTYFAAKKMAKVVATTPWRLAPWLALGAGLNELIQQDYDVDEKDVEALLKALPTWLQEKGGAYLLPWKDAYGRWQALDIGYLFPWQAIQETAGHLGRGEFSGAVSSIGLFEGALPDMITMLKDKDHKDPFTGRKVIDMADPPAKRVRDLMNYLWGMAAPTWLTDKGMAGDIAESFAGTGHKANGENVRTPTQKIWHAVGVNLYPLEPERTRAANLRGMAHGINEATINRNRISRDQSRTPEQRKADVKEQNDYIKRLRQQRIDYARESHIHPNLRTHPAGEPATP